MRYQVIDKRTGKKAGSDACFGDISDQCIVTQDGLVAWLDESGGWEIDENQEKYEIQLL